MAIKVNYCGNAAQDRMTKNGWRMVLRNGYSESPEALYERCSKSYKQVKVYWTGTMIKGIHNYFAFVK